MRRDPLKKPQKPQKPQNRKKSIAVSEPHQCLSAPASTTSPPCCSSPEPKAPKSPPNLLPGEDRDFFTRH
jgi:hypothetical protein